MAEQQVETLLKLNSAFEQMSLTILCDVLDHDFIHVTRPESIGMPERNKDQTIEHYGEMFLCNWVAIENMTYAILANIPGKIITHINYDVKLKSGPTVHYESFISLGIDQDPNLSGDRKVKYIDEFMDANAYSQAFAPYMAAKA